jgi:hypothetical protein
MNIRNVAQPRQKGQGAAPLNHVHKHAGDLLLSIATRWFIPIGKPVAYSEQTEGDNLGVKTWLERSFCDPFLNNLLKVPLIIFFPQNNLSGERLCWLLRISVPKMSSSSSSLFFFAK